MFSDDEGSGLGGRGRGRAEPFGELAVASKRSRLGELTFDHFRREVDRRMQERGRRAVETIVGFVDDADAVGFIKRSIAKLWRVALENTSGDLDKTEVPVLCTIGGTGVGKTTLLQYLMTSTDFKDWFKSTVASEHDPVMLFATFNQNDTFSASVEDDPEFAAASRMVASGLTKRQGLRGVHWLQSTQHLVDEIRRHQRDVPILILLDEVKNLKGALEPLLQSIAAVQQAELDQKLPTFVLVSSVDARAIREALRNGSPRGSACIRMVPLKDVHRNTVRSELWKAMLAVRRVRDYTDEQQQRELKLSLTVAIELTGGNLGKLHELAIKLQNTEHEYYRQVPLPSVTYQLVSTVEEDVFIAILAVLRMNLLGQRVFLGDGAKLKFVHSYCGGPETELFGCSVSDLLQGRHVYIVELADSLQACSVELVPDATMLEPASCRVPKVVMHLLAHVRERMFDFSAASVVKHWEEALPLMQMLVAHCSTTSTGTASFDAVFGQRHNETGLEIRAMDAPVRETQDRIVSANVSGASATSATLLVARATNQQAIEAVLCHFVFRGGESVPVLLQMRMYSQVSWATIQKWFLAVHDFAKKHLQLLAGKYIVALYVTQAATGTWEIADLGPGSVLVSHEEMSRVLGYLGVTALQYHIKTRVGATFGDFCNHVYGQTHGGTAQLKFPCACDFGDEDWEVDLVGCLVRFRKYDYGAADIEGRKKPVVTLGRSSTANVPQSAQLTFASDTQAWSDVAGNRFFVSLPDFVVTWDLVEASAKSCLAVEA